MSKKRRKGNQKREDNQQTSLKSSIGIWLTDSDGINCPGYVSLDHNPEIMTACKKIAELIGSLTIHLMTNTEQGDKRILNELSRKIDIEPEKHMTRSTWMQAIVMNLLLYGKGNSVVMPHTYNGTIANLEPISASRVSFEPIGYRDYKILVDGKAHDPDNMLHFVFNPDKTYLWKGRGVTINLQTVAENLKQAAATEKGFMESKWKPSVIVKVDSLIDEFSSPDGRKKLLDDYVKSSEVGEPWLIPADQFQVEQIRPLSLADLAISDTVEIDKRTVAAILGVPAFLLGVGEYNKEQWNNFVQSTIRTLVLGINQELTRKLIISPKMYLRLNHLSLLDWDIDTIYQVFGGLSDKGIVTGNEVRDRLGMEQLEGLDELRILENYIPSDMIGAQKKLIQGGSDNG